MGQRRVHGEFTSPSDLINMWRALAFFVAVAIVQVHGGDVDRDSIDSYDVNEPAYDVHTPSYGSYSAPSGYYSYPAPSGYSGYSAPSGYSGGSGYGYSDLIYSGYGSPNGGFLQSGNIAPTSVYKSVAYGGGYGSGRHGYSAPSSYSGGSGYGYSDLIYSGYGGHVDNAYGSPNGGFLQSGNLVPTSVYKGVAYGGGYGGGHGGYSYPGYGGY